MENRNTGFGIWMHAFLFAGMFVSLYGQQVTGTNEILDTYKEYPFVYYDKFREIDISKKDGNLQFEHNRKESMLVIKESKELFSEWRDHFNARHTLEDWRAYTLYTENNRERKSVVRDFTKAQERGDGIFHDDNYTYIYTFPNASTGSKLVSEIRTVDDSPEYPILFYFGDYQPTVSATFVIRAPRDVKIDYRLFGMDTEKITFTKTEKGRENIFTWRAETLDPYRRDIFAPGVRYIIPHIIAQVTEYNNGNEVVPVISDVNDYYRMVYKFIEERKNDTAGKIRELSEELTGGIAEQEDQVRSIFNWVRENIKYIAVEDGDNGFYPRPASQVLDQRYGDCKDFSSLLNAMMRAVDIPSGFAWVGTRHLPYDYTDMPTLLNDNHMVAVWWNGEQPVVLDGTAENHALYDVPAILEGKELLISRDSSDFMVYRMPVSSPADNMFVDSIRLNIGAEKVFGTGKLISTGEHAANARSRFKGSDPENHDRSLRVILGKSANNFTLLSTEIQEITDRKQPVEIHYNFEVPGYVTQLNDRMYINLSLDRFGKEINLEADRKMPVESEMTMQYTTVVDLAVPDSMQVSYVPEDSKFENELFSYEIHYTLTATGVRQEKTIWSDFQVLQTREELQLFREMINGLQSAYVETVLLEKR